MLKNGKTGNHNGQKNRKPKTEFFRCKNQKNRFKKWPKPKIPTPPSRREGFFDFLSRKRGRLWFELITKPERFLSFSIDL